jgi:hypothetical protein
MKNVHLMTLLQEGYTTCTVVFNPTAIKPTRSLQHEINAAQQPSYREPKAPEPKTYSYKVPLDFGLKAGDIAVVLVGADYRCVSVLFVDETPQIDVDAPFEMKWIVSKVDTARHAEQTARESAFLAEYEKTKRLVAKKRAIKLLMADMPNAPELVALLNKPFEGLPNVQAD